MDSLIGYLGISLEESVVRLLSFLGVAFLLYRYLLPVSLAHIIVRGM